MDIEGFPVVFTVPPEGQGMRLDAVLAFIFPGLGMRGRRRLWGWCRVMVNGRNRPPGFAVTRGELIRLEPLAGREGCGSGKHGLKRVFSRGEGEAAGLLCSAFSLRLVAVHADFIALHKPCGLHSAHVAGGRDASLESLLAERWEQLWRERGGPPSSLPLLLTRLDKATSGIVLAARSREAAECFRLAEKRGLVKKCYFAVVQGRLRHPLEIKNALAVDNRKATLVLAEEEPDATRHTLVTPLNKTDFAPVAGDEGGRNGHEGTLVLVRIQRGTRHQIRAHLAGAGFPLAGEWLYPSPTMRKKGMRLYLHHARVDFPGFSAADMPGWNLGERFPAANGGICPP